jgi:hypothetical protein
MDIEPIGPEAPNGFLPRIIPAGIEATIERLRELLSEGKEMLAYINYSPSQAVPVVKIYNKTFQTADGKKRTVEDMMWFNVNGQLYHT